MYLRISLGKSLLPVAAPEIKGFLPVLWSQAWEPWALGRVRARARMRYAVCAYACGSPIIGRGVHMIPQFLTAPYGAVGRVYIKRPLDRS